MCGIAGIIGLAKEQTIESMVTSMRHRGPNDSGVFRFRTSAFGMTRLSIQDTSPKGHQPMSSADKKIWIVFNGEMYNFQEERTKLESGGQRFISHSDTEVILRLYEQYGDDCVQHMRGMFAFAILDIRSGQERVLIARDQFGIKPLLYSCKNNQLIFASELKALLASKLISKNIDHESLRLLLTFGSVTQPRTILTDVQALLPGHLAIFESGVLRIHQYWKMSDFVGSGDTRAIRENYTEHISEVLRDSIKHQLVSDVPLGAFLSGGIDSSLLVAMMSKMSDRPTKTFSVKFGSSDPEQDESADARRIAEFLHTDHATVSIEDSVVRDRIRHVAWGLDQPTVDGVNSYFISMAARQHVTVAISGTGGDELFAGYPWFILMLQYAQQSWIDLGATGRRLIGSMVRHQMWNWVMRTRYAASVQGLRNQANFLAYYASRYQIFGPLGAMRLLSPAIWHDAHAGQSAEFDYVPSDELPKAETMNRVTALCLRTYAQNQLLRDIDAASMAHSLEVRVPFFDQLVLEAALSLPTSEKIGNVSQLHGPALARYDLSGAKKVLRDIRQTLLPNEPRIQKKKGFGLPFDAWLSGPLKETYTQALSNLSKRTEFFNPAEVLAVNDHYRRRQIDWAKPWLLMMTELWFEEVLEK